MGWLITTGASRADVIRDRVTDEETDTQRRQCLASAVRGNVLWTVWEITRKDNGETVRYIGCDLLGTDGEKNWGYKDMEESMGPYQVNCPLKFLSLVPQVTNEGWREKVRQHHARTHQKIVVGQTLKLVNAAIPHVKVTSVKPLRGTYLGATYRIPRRFIAPPEEQETTQQSKPTPPAATTGDKQVALFAA